ncbi:MAG: hypothetical protein CBC48_07005 [bacterium TMED88]|nr:MAG: hypothetical protein CBC48_07005 [bacterium TMED88]
MKILTLIPAAIFATTPALAGPYANIETQSKFAGSDYSKTSTDFFVGYEGEVGGLDYFIEGGPSMTTVDGGETDTIPAGKVGLSVKASERLKVYGELSASFDKVNDYGTKVGVKYNF